MDSPDLRLGRRIAIIGGSGSGKTTLARRRPPRLAAAEKAGVQVLHHRSGAETQRVLRHIIGGNPPRP